MTKKTPKKNAKAPRKRLAKKAAAPAVDPAPAKGKYIAPVLPEKYAEQMAAEIKAAAPKFNNTLARQRNENLIRQRFYKKYATT